MLLRIAFLCEEKRIASESIHFFFGSVYKWFLVMNSSLTFYSLFSTHGDERAAIAISSVSVMSVTVEEYMVWNTFGHVTTRNSKHLSERFVAHQHSHWKLFFCTMEIMELNAFGVELDKRCWICLIFANRNRNRNRNRSKIHRLELFTRLFFVPTRFHSCACAFLFTAFFQTLYYLNMFS